MTEHTPGPWTVEYKRPMTIEGNIHPVVDSGRFPTAFVPAWDNAGPGEVDGTVEAKANARLIAAAPDLLKAATDLLADVRRRYPGEALRCQYMIALDVAVTKATSNI